MKKISITLLSALFAAAMVRSSWAIDAEGIKAVDLPSLDMATPGNPSLNANALPENFLNDEGNLGNAPDNKIQELPLVSEEGTTKTALIEKAKTVATNSRQTRTATFLQKSARRLSVLGAKFLGKTPNQNASAESVDLEQSKKFDDADAMTSNPGNNSGYEPTSVNPSAAVIPAKQSLERSNDHKHIVPPTTYFGVAQAAAQNAVGGKKVLLMGAMTDFQNANFLWRYEFFSPNRLLTGDAITVAVNAAGNAAVTEKTSAIKGLMPDGIDLSALNVSLDAAWQVVSRGGFIPEAVSVDRDYAGRPVYRFSSASETAGYREVLVDAETGAITSQYPSKPGHTLAAVAAPIALTSATPGIYLIAAIGGIVGGALGAFLGIVIGANVIGNYESKWVLALAIALGVTFAALGGYATFYLFSL